MVRTADKGVRVSGGKAPRKQTATPKAKRSTASSSRRYRSLGGRVHPIQPDKIPEWQQPITKFSIKIDGKEDGKKLEPKSSCDDQTGEGISTTDSELDKNNIDESETSTHMHTDESNDALPSKNLMETELPSSSDDNLIENKECDISRQLDDDALDTTKVDSTSDKSTCGSDAVEKLHGITQSDEIKTSHISPDKDIGSSVSSNEVDDKQLEDESSASTTGVVVSDDKENISNTNMQAVKSDDMDDIDKSDNSSNFPRYKRFKPNSHLFKTFLLKED